MTTWYTIAGSPGGPQVSIDGENQLRITWRFAEDVPAARRQALAARLGRLWSEFLEAALEAVGGAYEDGSRIALRPRIDHWRCDRPGCHEATTDREADEWLVEPAGDFCPACQEKR